MSLQIRDAVDESISEELGAKRISEFGPKKLDRLRQRVREILKERPPALVFKPDLDRAIGARTAYEPYLLIGGSLIAGWGDWVITVFPGA